MKSALLYARLLACLLAADWRANLADLNAPFRILAELEELLTAWEVGKVVEIIGKAGVSFG